MVDKHVGVTIGFGPSGNEYDNSGKGNYSLKWDMVRIFACLKKFIGWLWVSVL